MHLSRRQFLLASGVSIVTPLIPGGVPLAAAVGAQRAASAAGPNPEFTPGVSAELGWDSAGAWTLNNRPFQFFGGEIHPARVPWQYWEQRIKMLRALGCNTISLYIMWNFHERPDGTFDFTSTDKNIGNFIDLCAANNMWVIVRAGPYVCAEWDFGGLPPRLLAEPRFRDAAGKLQIRGDFAPYLAEVKKWLAALYAGVIEGRTLAAGGPIMLLAVENEYTSWSPTDPNHAATLASMWRALGYGEKLCVCDGYASGFKDRHLILPENTAYGMTEDGRSVANYAKATQNYGVASFGAECYTGWLTHWGDSAQIVNVDGFARQQVASLTRAGCSFVLYVGHGGTSFGFTAGCNGTGISACQPALTSYDYGAPVSENGRQNPNYRAIADAFRANAAYPVAGYPIPSPIPTIREGEISPLAPGQFSYGDFLSAPARTVSDVQPLSIEALALRLNRESAPAEGIYPSGIAVYQTRLAAAGSGGSLTFDRPPDYALVFLNGRRVSDAALTTVRSGRIAPVTTLDVGKAASGDLLQIVCMPFGRTNVGGDEMRAEGRGLSGSVKLNGRALTGWTMSLSPLGAQQLAALAFTPAAPMRARPFFARGSFSLEVPADLYIDLAAWGTGYVLVNGRNLGRYWSSAGPQTRLYCPGAWLTAGENQIVIFELQQAEAGSVGFFPSSGLPYKLG